MTAQSTPEVHPVIAAIGQSIAADFCQTEELGRQIAAAIERRIGYTALVEALKLALPLVEFLERKGRDYSNAEDVVTRMESALKLAGVE